MEKPEVVHIRELRALLGRYKYVYPEVQAAMNPRWYQTRDDYYDPAYLGTTATGAALGLMKQHSTFGVKKDDTSVATVMACSLLADYKVPTYFVDPKLLSSLIQTQPPEEMLLSDIKWPFPAMRFILPVDFCVNYFGGHVPTLIIATFPPGWHHEPGIFSFTGTTGLHAEGDKGGIIVIMDFYRIATDAASYYSMQPTDGARNLRDVMIDRSAVQLSDFYKDDPFLVVTPNDTDRLKMGVDLAYQLLLVMQAEPGLIEPEKILLPGRSIGKGKTKKVISKSLWQPAFIGRNYKPPCERQSTGGTHASPTMHWRRGHWRHQAHGPRREMRKLIWLKPVLVNP